MLKALVLCGGESRRMGTDKSQLRYHGITQTEHCKRLLESLGLATFISARKGQYPPSPNVLFDQGPSIGPAGGILAAYSHDSQSAWLVLACDFPLLQVSHVRTLLDHRDPSRAATVIQVAGHLDPLFAVWETEALRQLKHQVESACYGPVSTLRKLDCKVLELPESHFLRNVNTPEEALAAQDFLRSEDTDKRNDATLKPPLLFRY